MTWLLGFPAMLPPILLVTLGVTLWRGADGWVSVRYALIAGGALGLTYVLIVLRNLAELGRPLRPLGGVTYAMLPLYSAAVGAASAVIAWALMELLTQGWSIARGGGDAVSFLRAGGAVAVLILLAWRLFQHGARR